MPEIQLDFASATKLPKASGNGAPQMYMELTAVELHDAAHRNRQEAGRHQRRAKKQPVWNRSRGRKAQHFYAESTAAMLHEQLAVKLDELAERRFYRRRPARVKDLTRRSVREAYEAAGIRGPS